jgi:microcystin-dependent protein
MPEPYVGEIRLFGGNFAPLYWSFCDGSLLSISDYQVLYALIGTTYGGNGTSNFALPDLRSRVPVGTASGYGLGEPGGVETVTLLASNMPPHNHALQTAATGTSPSPAAQWPSVATAPGGVNISPTLYGTGTAQPVSFSPPAITANPGGQPHANVQPYQAIAFIISLFGIYPSPA